MLSCDMKSRPVFHCWKILALCLLLLSLNMREKAFKQSNNTSRKLLKQPEQGKSMKVKQFLGMWKTASMCVLLGNNSEKVTAKKHIFCCLFSLPQIYEKMNKCPLPLIAHLK